MPDHSKPLAGKWPWSFLCRVDASKLSWLHLSGYAALFEAHLLVGMWRRDGIQTTTDSVSKLMQMPK